MLSDGKGDQAFTWLPFYLYFMNIRSTVPLFFLDLFQRFLAGRFHVAALRVFEFNDDAGVFVRNFDQDVAVAGAGLGIGQKQPVLPGGSKVPAGCRGKSFLSCSS